MDPKGSQQAERFTHVNDPYSPDPVNTGVGMVMDYIHRLPIQTRLS